MKAVLLAAGKGIRLRPITDKIPKQMIKIAGKPLLEYIINDLVSCGFDKICIVIGHHGDQIKEYFLDGKKFNAKIQYVEQRKFKGTADATRHTKKFVNNESFLLYLSDTMIPNFDDILKNLLKSNEDVEILSTKILHSQLQKVGNIQINDKNYVTKIIEKPSKGTGNLAWAGIVLFRTNLIFKKIDMLKPSSRGEYDITHAINELTISKTKVKNHLCDEYIDYGTPNGFHKLINFILRKKHSECKHDFSLFNNLQINEPVHIGKNCSIGKNTTLGPNTSIDDNVKIGSNVQIKESVILDGTKISSNRKILNSLISDTFIINYKN